MTVKRTFDVAVVLLLSPLWLPAIGLLGLVVRLKLGSPVFFYQKRPGKDARIFELIKFRTMTEERDASGEMLPDHIRLTRFGQWLRSTSLDELPELLNVLRGEMSLVGPRPLISSYLTRYTPRQARRHEVLPGLTGLAQIEGRNTLSWEEKFELDLRYVEQHAFWLDLKILFQTLKVVATRRGISARGHVTMPEFLPEPSKDRRGSTTKPKAT